MKYSNGIVLLVVLTFIFTISCETTERIDDFPLRPSKLVVNCYFAPDSAWEFQVSKSLSVLDNAELKLVDDASIVLYRDSAVIDSVKAPDTDGLYRSGESLPQPGERYRIEVLSPDFKNALYAEGTVPSPVPVTGANVIITDSAFFYTRQYEWGAMPPRGNVQGTLELTFSDPPGTDNYYQVSLYSFVKDYDYNDSTIFWIYKRDINFTVDDPVVQKTEAYYGAARFSDELIDGQTYKLKLDFEDWEASLDQVYFIDLVSLNRDSYLYRSSVQEYYESSGDPFSEPVLIYSNIENGFGIFAGYSTFTYQVPLFDD